MNIENIYYKFHINGYSNFKNELLDSINSSWSSEIKSDEDNITNTDWERSGEVFSKKWSQILFHNIYNQLKEIYSSIGYNNFQVNNVWFQEYGVGSYHGWHDHDGASFSNVFFLNFSKDNPATEFLIDNEIIKSEVNEGDLIVFPGNLIHRSPPNKSEKNRLIIAFNTTVD